jgi:hypothetical protein
MVRATDEDIASMYDRRRQYMAERGAVPITDEQYLWWDNIIANHYDRALERYIGLISGTSLNRNRCFDTGLPSPMRMKFDGKKLYAHRFTYIIRVVLPLSTKDVVRHQCANFRCLNPAHVERGDQAQNFLDLLAARAYGVRWDLLPWDPLDTIK